MNDFTEARFGHLRALTYEDKLKMIEELEEDLEAVNAMIDDPYTSSEQRSELYSDASQDEAQIEYLKSILNEKQL